MTVLFVCTGNTCRSAMAEAIARQLAAERGLDLFFQSRGLAAAAGEPASEGARMVAAAHMVNLLDHRAAPLTESDLANADAVYAMTGRHRDQLCADFPQWAEKIKTLCQDADIPDPWGGDLSVFFSVYRALHSAVGALPPLQP